jgi:hypothetical protein
LHCSFYLAVFGPTLRPRFIWTGIGTAFYNPAVVQLPVPRLARLARRRRNYEMLDTSFGLIQVDSLIKPA